MYMQRYKIMCKYCPNKGWGWYRVPFSYQQDRLTGDKCQAHMWLIVTWDRDNMKRCTRRPAALSRRVWVLSIIQWWTITHAYTEDTIIFTPTHTYDSPLSHTLDMDTSQDWWGKCIGSLMEEIQPGLSHIWKVINYIVCFNQTLGYQVGSICRNEFLIFVLFFCFFLDRYHLFTFLINRYNCVCKLWELNLLLKLSR